MDKVCLCKGFNYIPSKTMVIQILKDHCADIPNNAIQFERNRLIKKAIHELLRTDDADFQEERATNGVGPLFSEDML